MNAMIFAAGLGTRLKPLTDTMPKALVPVDGRPLLQYVLDKLHFAGITNVVVNVHHFADQIKDYLQDKDIKISDESDMLLETGGGLKKAQPLFDDAESILIHNVDILSNLDINALWEQHKSDATLVVSWRKTKRYLLFNDDMRLVGWTNIETGEVKSPYAEIVALEPEIKKMNGNPVFSLSTSHCTLRLFAFAGIHIISRQMFAPMQEWPDRFSIIDFYLANCRDYDIRGYVQPDLRLMDVGKIDTLHTAEEFIKSL